MKRGILSLWLILGFLLPGCGNLVYSRNVNKWKNQGISHYRFTVVVQCYCPIAGVEATYEVGDGVPNLVSIDMPYDREPDIDFIQDMYADYTTIESIFAFLEETFVEADKVTVAYDSEYGFPDRLRIDWIEQAVDDEQWIAITSFEPLP
jgi:hypothetical protein